MIFDITHLHFRTRRSMPSFSIAWLMPALLALFALLAPLTTAVGPCEFTDDGCVPSDAFITKLAGNDTYDNAIDK
jgi:hypothetical protein